MGKGNKRQSQNEAEEIYTMEEILGYKSETGKDFYLVKWKGYKESDATWEPRSNILDPGEDILEQMSQVKRVNRKRKSCPSESQSLKRPSAKRREQITPDTLTKTSQIEDDSIEGSSSDSQSQLAISVSQGEPVDKEQAVETGTPKEVVANTLKAKEVKKKQKQPPSTSSQPAQVNAVVNNQENGKKADEKRETVPDSGGGARRRYSAPLGGSTALNKSGGWVTRISALPFDPGYSVTVVLPRSPSSAARTGDQQETRQVSLQEARTHYTQELLDFLLARIRFLSQKNKDSA